MDYLQDSQKSLLWNTKCLRQDVMFECCHLGKSFQSAGPQSIASLLVQSTKPAESDAATSMVFSTPGVRMEVSGGL